MDATNLIEIDGWRVDPDAGLVYGKRGRPVGSLDGSGYYQADGRSRGAGQPHHHRLIWIAVNGPVPDGKQINHIDGNKANNKISNLELVTQQENILHAYRIGLKSNRGERHPSRKLYDAAIIEVRHRHAAGESKKSLAAAFGVHRRTINDIVLGHAWSHVKDI